MLINTRHFGELEIEGSDIISFSNGIPGLKQAKEYVIINNPDSESPFKWLQSVDIPELAFAIIDPFSIKKDYDFELNDEAVRELGIKEEKDVLVYSIVVVPEDISKISMNLKAPLIINTERMKGTQIILDTDKYNVRHYILDEIRKQEVAENAGTDKEKGSDNYNK